MKNKTANVTTVTRLTVFCINTYILRERSSACTKSGKNAMHLPDDLEHSLKQVQLRLLEIWTETVLVDI